MKHTRGLAKVLWDFLPTVYNTYGALNARQYAYRAEAAGMLPKGKRQFDYVDEILVELREAGKMPWSAVLDSSRSFDPFEVHASEDPEAYVRGWARWFLQRPDRFALPKWQFQKKIPVIVTEKDGLVPYFERVARDRFVTIYAGKGQIGKSHLHEKVLPWITRWVGMKREIHLLYLGDCDDEGYQITQTLVTTLSEWTAFKVQYDDHAIDPKARPRLQNEGSPVIFSRLALDEHQVEMLNLPKMEINQKSMIANRFVQFKCELEALSPDDLRQVILGYLEAIWDKKAEARRVAVETKMRGEMQKMISGLANKWPY